MSSAYSVEEEGFELYFGAANLSSLRLDKADLSNMRVPKANCPGRTSLEQIWELLNSGKQILPARPSRKHTWPLRTFPGQPA